MSYKTLPITFDVKNIDPTDKEYLELRKQAIATALNELSFPEDGSEPVNKLGEHGASVHVIFDHKNRSAVINVNGDACSGGCTTGRVASAQTIHDHFNAVVVGNNVLKSFVVYVGGETLDQLIQKYGPAKKAGCGAVPNFI
jgi:hypothetical protein